MVLREPAETKGKRLFETMPALEAAVAENLERDQHLMSDVAKEATLSLVSLPRNTASTWYIFASTSA
jgi:hypothetical protein